MIKEFTQMILFSLPPEHLKCSLFFLLQTYTISLGYSVQALVVVELRDLIEDSER